MPAPRHRLTREQRAVRASKVAEVSDGVAHRADLRAVGVSRADVRSEVEAGRWLTAGRHTVVVGNRAPVGRAVLWQAVWESGSGAALDGVTALLAAGLTGFQSLLVDVSVPRRNRSHRVQGVRRHRRTVMPVCTGAALRRVDVPTAAVNAAVWAASDRQAVLLLCLVLQQRLTTPARLLRAWRSSGARITTGRRRLLSAVVADLCDGAHSLGELDFGRLCRRAGLPPPTRQVVRHLPGGRVYLDAVWEDIGLVVEVDGGHHALALAVVEDALRQNELVLREDRVLRIPVLGLRLTPDRFMAQVAEARRRWGTTTSATVRGVPTARPDARAAPREGPPAGNGEAPLAV